MPPSSNKRKGKRGQPRKDNADRARTKPPPRKPGPPNPSTGQTPPQPYTVHDPYDPHVPVRRQMEQGIARSVTFEMTGEKNRELGMDRAGFMQSEDALRPGNRHRVHRPGVHHPGTPPVEDRGRRDLGARFHPGSAPGPDARGRGVARRRSPRRIERVPGNPSTTRNRGTSHSLPTREERGHHPRDGLGRGGPGILPHPGEPIPGGPTVHLRKTHRPGLQAHIPLRRRFSVSEHTPPGRGNMRSRRNGKGRPLCQPGGRRPAAGGRRTREKEIHAHRTGGSRTPEQRHTR